MLAVWAVGAEMLVGYEAQYPADPAPREGLEAVRVWIQTPSQSCVDAVVDAIGHHDSVWSCVALALDAANAQERPLMLYVLAQHASGVLGASRVRTVIAETLKRYALEKQLPDRLPPPSR